jgi:hypothetical protein
MRSTPFVGLRAHWTGAAAVLAVVAVLGLAPAGVARATSVTLEDGTNVVRIDPDSVAGLYAWEIAGTSHLAQQWFWYRIGDTGPEASIDTLERFATNQSSPDQVAFGFRDGASPTFQMQLVLNLTSSGNGGILHDAITIDNLTADPMDFHFFQYCDFDLGGTPGGDRVTMTGSPINTARQTSALADLSESVVTSSQLPSRAEAALFPTTLVKLTDGDADPLASSTAGPMLGPVGPGDVTWAFQWDFAIPANGTVIISKIKRLDLVPEPTTLAGLALGVAGLGRYLRRRRAGRP